MVLLSALEDLVTRTLAHIPTLLGKLEYVSLLRKGKAYEHWGLARSHGDVASSQALSDAHKYVWLKLLRTPVRELWADIEQERATAEEGAVDYLRRLRDSESSLIPAETAGGSVLHFSSVLEALFAISQARQNASRPAA